MSWRPHLKPNVGPFSTTLKRMFTSAPPFTKWDILNPPTLSRSKTQPPSGLQKKNKQQKSNSMDMRYYWIQDRVAQMFFWVYWRPGHTNLGNYFTKHFPPSYHRSRRSTYLQSDNYVASLRFCEGALIPSRDASMNRLIPPWESSMSGMIHHNPCLGLRHDWAQNLMSQHNRKHKEPSRAH